LQEYNERRKKDHLEGDEISREIFEVTVTKIEKEWFELEKRIPKNGGKEHVVSEDSTCAICDEGDCENTNAIVFCDGCNLAVHQGTFHLINAADSECYGVPYIPEGQWLCRVCHVASRDPPQCIFCPNEGGALKQTADSSWGHLLCALWIPEADVANHIFMEPIEGVDRIPKSRWKLVCYICNKPGACIQCSSKSCYLAFHVSCARRSKLSLKFKGPMSNLDRGQMKAYCDRHCPVCSLSRLSYPSWNISKCMTLPKP
jgi:NuA3 HAT complex component NTO1